MEENEAGGSCFRPSVVLFLGHFEDGLIRDLTKGVERRLGENLDPSFPLISWGEVHPEENRKEPFAELFEQFMDLSYWQDHKALVGDERGPSMGHLAEVNVIILAKSEATDAALGEDCLTPLMTLLKKSLSARLTIHPFLIIVGAKAPARNDLEKFRLRFWLNETSLGGVKVPASHLYEVCQTLILSLTCSDLTEKFDQLIINSAKKNAWVVLGNSAIYADLALMRNYVTDQILLEFIKPLLAATMRPDQKQLVDTMVQSLAEEYYRGMLADCLEILKDTIIFPHSTWLIKKKDDHNIDSMDILPRSRLRTLLEAIRISPSSSTMEECSKHFAEIENSIANKLSLRATDSLKFLLDEIGFLLDKSIHSSKYLDRLESGEKLISITAEWPSGIRPAEYALSSLISALKGPDFTINQKKGYPFSAQGEAFYTRLSQEIECTAVGGFRQILRLKRSANNIVGQFAFLIPAWPLLYGLLDRFTKLTSAQSAWLSLIPVVIPPIVIALLHYFKVQSELRKHRKVIIAQAANFVTHIIAKVLRQYRKQLYGSLYYRSQYLSLLVKDIDESFVEIGSRIENVQLSRPSDNKETPTLFELADFQLCNDWAERTAAVVNSSQGGFNSLASLVLKDNVFPILEESGKIISLLDVFRNIVSTKEKDVFSPGVMFVRELAENQAELSEGKLWDWLYTKAHPLGNPAVDQLVGTFTIMVINNMTTLSGGYGQGTKYWPANAETSLSRLENEIQCFRGLIVSL